MNDTGGAAQPPVERPAPQKRHGPLRRMYEWVLAWADSKHAVTALFVLAFTESSFFPIPPDVLLLALCLGAPKKSMKYALVCSVGSVLGGIGGYAIGWAAEPVGRFIITALADAGTFEKVAQLYQEDAFFYVVVAAFTPVPYKVFTIAAGMFHDWVPLQTLVLASILGRSARFFLVAGLIWKFGRPIKTFIDTRFNQLMWVFMILLIGGFAAIKFMGGGGAFDRTAILESLNNPHEQVRLMRYEELTAEAGRDFGFDPAHPLDAPENAGARRAIEEWAQRGE